MRSATYATATTFLCIFVTFCGVSIYKSYAPLSTGRAQAAAVGGVACSSLRGAGSANSCKMPNLSHTLPNCQHSLAVCLFICFAHGLHDLINTPAKLQRLPHSPLPTVSLVGVPCNSSVAARKLFPFAAHTRNMLTLKHTHSHISTLNVLPMLDFDMWPSVDVAALPVSQIPVADDSHAATAEVWRVGKGGGEDVECPLSESRANLICCVKVVLKCDQQQQRQQRLTCPLANFKWNLVNTFKRAKQHSSESTQNEANRKRKFWPANIRA